MLWGTYVIKHDLFRGLKSKLTLRLTACRSVSQYILVNLGCLHPVARVISYDVGFNPSTQRHYRRLIYYLYIHSYMFRSYDHHQTEKVLLP
jgi:hypothetical protein